MKKLIGFVFAGLLLISWGTVSTYAVTVPEARASDIGEPATYIPPPTIGPGVVATSTPLPATPEPLDKFFFIPLAIR